MAGGMSWTEKWMCFDNSYFHRPQSLDSKDLLWLPTDQALYETPEFKPYFERYATDKAAFYDDYAQVHKKMSELGARFEPESGILL